MGPRGTNAKKAAGNERKEANEAKKKAAKKKEQEKAEAAEWAKGSNVRGASRAEAAAQKSDEAARRRREKAELAAAEEESMSSSTKIKKAPGAGMASKSKKKNKNKNELSLLEEALVGDADKKVKADKKAARLRRENEERLRLERIKRDSAAGLTTTPTDSMTANTDAMIGNTNDEEIVGRKANVQQMSDGYGGSGIDSALVSMSLGKSGADAGGIAAEKHPEKRVKALHKEFEERMMPEMKEQFPGLRLTQYKEKIFVLWKKSPENPLNWT